MCLEATRLRSSLMREAKRSLQQEASPARPTSEWVKPNKPMNQRTDGSRTNKGTRVIVFGGKPQEAPTAGEEIAKKAYWNNSYFGGTVKDLKQAGFWQNKSSSPEE
jgi:hypothetical protein